MSPKITIARSTWDVFQDEVALLAAWIGDWKRDPKKPPSEAVKSFEGLNLYQILDINPEDVMSEELKRAYRRKALQHHPDKNPEDIQGATQRFAKVQQAYETLSDELRREEYHNLLAQESRGPRGQNETPQRPAEDAKPLLVTLLDYRIWLMLLILLALCIVRVATAFFFTIKSGFHSVLVRAGMHWDPFITFNPDIHTKRTPRPRGPDSISPMDFAFFLSSLRHVDYTGFSAADFMGLVGNPLECIAFDEETIAGGPKRPRIGSLNDPWCQDDGSCPHPGDVRCANAFWKYWTNFKTRKDFSWLEEHPGRRSQLKARYEEMIRDFATKMQKGDPRFLRYQLWRERVGPSSASNGARKGNKKKKKSKR